MEISETVNERHDLTRLDKARLYGKLAQLMATNLPRLFWHQLMNFGDYSDERQERDGVAFEPVEIKASRYILEKEIGSESFRLRTADRMQEIKDRRDLPSSTLIHEM